MTRFRASILFFVAITFVFSETKTQADAYILRFGPASIGSGGSNPLGIPPSGRDLEFSWLQKNNWETGIGIPGLFVGKRILTDKSGTYLGVGGAAIVNANGAGIGGYSAFGYDFGWDTFRFNIEYKQYLGLGSSGVMSPFAIRLGVGLWFH